EAMVMAHAAEVTADVMRVNLVDPGPMATQLRALAFPGEPTGTQPDPSEKAAAFVGLADPSDTRHGQRIIL
ncbi:MAG: oxidoreductase, partial [Pseudomonadota bacterium]